MKADCTLKRKRETDEEADNKLKKLAGAVTTILDCLGEDPKRQGLLKTPERYAKALLYFTEGYNKSLKEVVNEAIFDIEDDDEDIVNDIDMDEFNEVEVLDDDTACSSSSSSMDGEVRRLQGGRRRRRITNNEDTEHDNGIVLVKDIDVFSLCEHHLLPFTGKIHVAYIPNKRVIGLSKIARITEMISRRLQIQERLTKQVADILEEVLNPKGIAIVMEASHLCMVMRGVQKTTATTTTCITRGVFKHDTRLKDEFLSLVNKKLN